MTICEPACMVLQLKPKLADHAMCAKETLWEIPELWRGTETDGLMVRRGWSPPMQVASRSRAHRLQLHRINNTTARCWRPAQQLPTVPVTHQQSTFVDEGGYHD